MVAQERDFWLDIRFQRHSCSQTGSSQGTRVTASVKAWLSPLGITTTTSFAHGVVRLGTLESNHGRPANNSGQMRLLTAILHACSGQFLIDLRHKLQREY